MTIINVSVQTSFQANNSKFMYGKSFDKKLNDSSHFSFIC